MKKVTDENGIIIKEISALLDKGNSHISLDEALQDIPFHKITEKPDGLPYSIWQLAEHIRISQWDILEFCKSKNHVSPKWPDEYWPDNDVSKTEWNDCIAQIKKDRQEMIDLLQSSPDHLFVPFPYGDGQSLFKEALVMADHNSYHTAEIVVLRRLTGTWKH